MRDDAYSEVLVGRLFVTLGVKFGASYRKLQRIFAGLDVEPGVINLVEHLDRGGRGAGSKTMP